MRYIIFLLMISLTPIASASSVTRTYSISDIYFNSSGTLTPVNKEYNITLTPSPLTEFDIPGYYITEYLPDGFKFVNTNADKHTLTGNKLQLLKFLPSSSSSTLTYTLQYKKDVSPLSSFYGTYLDENRNYGIITSPISTQSGTSGSTIIDSTPEVSYIKSEEPSMSTPPPTHTSGFIPLAASQVQITPYTPVDDILSILFIIIGLVGMLYLYIILRQYKKTYHMKLLSSGEVIIDKEHIGITKIIRFYLDTENNLSVNINGNILNVIASVKNMPCDKRCFDITIRPDGKDHDGSIIFTKKDIKNTKYKIK